MHLLQGIDGNKGKKEELEVLLDDLVNRQCKKISKLAEYIQNMWEEQYSMDKKHCHKN